MAQPPVTVTYSLEEVLGQISQKLDRLDNKVEDLGEDMDHKLAEFRKDVDAKFDHLQQDIVELKVGQTRMETEINGIGKRLDTQEFINRSVVVGFVLALAAGAVKLFFPGSLN